VDWVSIVLFLIGDCLSSDVELANLVQRKAGPRTSPRRRISPQAGNCEQCYWA
jgi:hypothetical protein